MRQIIKLIESDSVGIAYNTILVGLIYIHFSQLYLFIL